MALQALPRPKRRFSIWPYLFLAPALISMAALTFFPAVYTIFIAFTNYSQKHFLSYSFVGLKNFYNLLAPGGAFANIFLPVLVWTLCFALITVTINYLVGFGLAVLLNNPHLKERSLYRTMLIVPYAIPSAVSIMIWQGLLNQDFGAVDALLHTLHLPMVPWLSDPTGARAAILMVNLWLGFPFNMIVCLGALQSISADIYEAAAVDGATKFQQLRKITLPLVFQVSMPVVVGGFSFNMMNLGIVYLLTSGNPPRTDTQWAGATDVLATFVYKLTSTIYRYDLAAALGIIIFAISVAFSLVGFRLSGAFKETQA